MKKIVLCFIFIFSCGCATIVGDKSQLISLNSNPNNANITIVDEKGMNVFSGKTPTTVTLNKSDGSYWGGKTYTVTISKEGYANQIIPVTTSPNGWYIAGNFIFGGLIGWFIIDPLSGAMYNLSPENINSSLSNDLTHNNNMDDGNISIVLLQDVPNHLRDKMKRIK